MSGKKTIEIRFDSRAKLREEYAANLINGGIFLPTDSRFAPRESVMVGIELAFCGEALRLSGEIVHVIPPELATSGALPGVAVQLDLPAPELREMLEPFIGELEDAGLEGAAEQLKRASRVRARVRARLRTRDGDIECRTRNVSASGILVSTPGRRVPVGKRVVLSLSDPDSGDEIEVAGKVARHLKGEGGVVAALGIHFTPAPDRAEAIKGFIARLQASEHSRHLGGIGGAIEERGVLNLLQSYGASADQGTLTLMREAQEGFVMFERGYVLEARVGATEGVKALARMLTWVDGRFEFHASLGPDVSRDTPVALDAALTDAIEAMQECSRVDQTRFAPDARIEPGARVGRGGSDLTKIESAIMELAVVGMSVQRILDIVPEPDAEIYQTLGLLLDLDRIRIRESSTAR